MLLTNVKIRGKMSSVYVNSEGLIECLGCERKDGITVDCQGGELRPPFVNSHAHLSQTLTLGRGRPNETGRLMDGLSILREDVLPHATVDDVRMRLEVAEKLMFMTGTLHVRDHEPVLGGNARRLLPVLHGTSLVSIQVVACPSPSLSYSDNSEEMERTLEAGADVVGAMPHGEDRETGVKSISTVFDLAQKFNKPVDGHVDEIDDPKSRFSFHMVAEAKRRGLGRRTALSHVVSSQYFGCEANQLVSLMRDAGVSVVVNPETNLHLQGRYTEERKPVGLAPVGLLLSNGVNVSLGSDNVGDVIYPLGDFNMLKVLEVCRTVEHECPLELISFNGFKTLNLNYPKIEVGEVAKFVVIREGYPLPLLVVNGRNYALNKGKSLMGVVD